jgi:hypothetical protein
MTLQKAEKPFQGARSYFDRPLTTPETICAERLPMERMDLLDPNLTSRVEALWEGEDEAILRIVHNEAETRAPQAS